MALPPDGQLTHVMHYEAAHTLECDLGFVTAPALKGWAERHARQAASVTAPGDPSGPPSP